MMDQTTVIHINHMYLVNLPHSGHQAAGAWQTHVKPPLTDTGRGEQEMFHLFMPCAPKPNYMGSFPRDISLLRCLARYKPLMSRCSLRKTDLNDHFVLNTAVSAVGDTGSMWA